MTTRTIPHSWTLARISDIAVKGSQRKPALDEFFTYIDIGSIDRKLKQVSGPQVIGGDQAPSRARKVIEAGDVLVSLTRPNLNAVALISPEYHDQIASTGFEVIKPVLVESRYIFGLVRSKEFIDAISGAVQGALYPAAKSADVQSFQFPLPPLAEQKVIADKFDTLLAQVDSTKARLERIPQTLKRFRQSVLAAAVSGRLTEEWRGTLDYRSLDLGLEKSDEAILSPVDWQTATLAEACKVISGNAFKSNEFSDIGTTPAIKISNVQYGSFEKKNQQYLPEAYLSTYQRFKVLPDDLLMALTRPITNDTLKVCRYPASEPAGLLNQRVAKFLFHNEPQKEFFELLFQSNYFKLQVYDKLSETLQPNLSPVDLKKFIIALHLTMNKLKSSDESTNSSPTPIASNNRSTMAWPASTTSPNPSWPKPSVAS